MTGILGRKIGMTRIFDDNGKSTPVTVVECQPNTIVQLKTEEKDGYDAIVVGFAPYNKPSRNKKYKFVREFRVESVEGYKIGDQVSVAQIAADSEVLKMKVTGTSKGRGFAGVIKRHNFSRGPETHGSHHHRAPGSIGACAQPGRVAKGKKMAGHMGNERVTRRNVPVVSFDADKHIIALKGAVPGAYNSFVQLTIEA